MGRLKSHSAAAGLSTSKPTEDSGREPTISRDGSQGLPTSSTLHTKYVVHGDRGIDNFNLHDSQNWSAWNFTVGTNNVTKRHPTKASFTDNDDDDHTHCLRYSALSPLGVNDPCWYGKVTCRYWHFHRAQTNEANFRMMLRTTPTAFDMLPETETPTEPN